MQVENRIMLLRVTAAVIVIFGIVIAAAAHPALDGTAVFLADLMIWPLDGLQGFSAQETRFVGAVGGGVMAGWGVMIWSLAPLLQTHERIAVRAISTSMATWFVIDCAGSLAAGVPLNILGNLVFLGMVCVAIYPGARTANA